MAASAFHPQLGYGRGEHLTKAGWGMLGSVCKIKNDKCTFSFQPPKNSYVNYKVLQEHIKEKKAAKEEEKRTAKDTDIFKKKKRKGQEDR